MKTLNSPSVITPVVWSDRRLFFSDDDGTTAGGLLFCRMYSRTDFELDRVALGVGGLDAALESDEGPNGVGRLLQYKS